MSDLKYSLLWAIAIVVLTIVVFALNYSGYSSIFPLYKVLVWPGIVTLRLVSEEMVFLPKFLILLSGQFIAYFIAVFLARKSMHLWR